MGKDNAPLSLTQLMNLVTDVNAERIKIKSSSNTDARVIKNVGMATHGTFYEVSITEGYSGVIIGLDDKTAKFTISLSASGSPSFTFNAGDVTSLMTFNSVGNKFYISSDKDTVKAQLILF